MSPLPLHVVLGAGPAGTSTTAALTARGLPTRHVSRSPITNAPSGVETVTADVSDPDSAVAATTGATVIYHAVNVPYAQQVAQMPRIAEAVLAAAAVHGAKLVVLDTLYPYGKADGGHITEKTSWAATSRKGRMRAALDRRYLSAHAAGDARVTLGRAADFFGPGVFSSTLGGAFFPPALAGDPVLAFGDIDLPHSYSYVPDVAEGLVTLGTDPRADGTVWHLPCAPAESTAAIHRDVARILGREISVTVLDEPTPFGPFDADFMAEYAEMFYQHRIPQNMVSEAFENTFDVHPTPLSRSLAATVSWFAGAQRAPRRTADVPQDGVQPGATPR